MFCKERLNMRLDQMLDLPDDWDGFGTGSIAISVYKTVARLIEYIELDGTDTLRVFVGVSYPGSAFIEIVKNPKLYELTVLPDGTIHYDELIEGNEIGSGIFLLSKQKLNDIING